MFLFYPESFCDMAGHRTIQLDQKNVEVAFFVRWFGFIPVTGRFASAHGVVSVGDYGLGETVVAIDIDADSIRTGISLRDRHLRGVRFLDTARFPCISFRSSTIVRDNGSLAVKGTISLRGVEQFVGFYCLLDKASNASLGTMSLATEFTLDRSVFGVGKPRGLLAYSPLFGAISDEVRVAVRLNVPVLSEVLGEQPVLGH